MKKRYQITLTQSVVDQMKEDIQALGLPAPVFSLLIDEAIRSSLAPMLHKMADRKLKGEQLTFQEIIADALELASDAMKQ